MADTQAGWYDDGSGAMRWWDGQRWTEQVQTAVSPVTTPYVVLQVVLAEQLLGAGSVNLTELEMVINAQAAQGYRLHTITTAESGSTGFGGGGRTLATMVFERLS